MLQRIVNIFFPHRCLRCEDILGDVQGLCSACWSKIHFITPPLCYQCGLPLEVDLGHEAICSACARGEQLFSHVRSCLVYDDESKDIILKFKHGDALYGAPLYAKWMKNAGHGLVESADIIAPVPLHWTRLFQRTYNQAHVLAKEIARISPASSYYPRLLRRVKHTKSQGHLTLEQRKRNLAGSITLDTKRIKRIKGSKVLLVDDVMTSGATLNACAKALLSHGASRVNAITLGRATRG